MLSRRSDGELERSPGQRSRPRDDGAARRKQAQASNEGAGTEADSAKADDDMFARVGVAAE